MMDEKIVRTVETAVYEALDMLTQPGTKRFDDLVRITARAATEAHTAALAEAGWVIVSKSELDSLYALT